MKKNVLKKEKPKRVDLQAQAHLPRPRPAIFFLFKEACPLLFFWKKK
jgi:hypothetical protein